MLRLPLLCFQGRLPSLHKARCWPLVGRQESHYYKPCTSLDWFRAQIEADDLENDSDDDDDAEAGYD